MPRPRLALSLGDPCGIGPELAVKAWRRAKQGTGHVAAFHAYGSLKALKQAGLEETDLGPAWPNQFSLTNLDAQLDAALTPVPGQPHPGFAPLVTGAIEAGVAAVQAREARALVTLPIAKSVLYAAGFPHPGHTEYLGALAGVGADQTLMMLVSPELRVVPATLHLSLRDALTQLGPERLEWVIRQSAAALVSLFKISKPRIVVSGLNPHAGEDGALGREEVEWIAPLVTRLRAEGLNLRGPLPADTLFHARARATYDLAIGMTHDQALIPLKTLAFDAGVNLTLGLPFVRTSPDHGTAFDLAGKGEADPGSLLAALQLADELSA